MKTQRLFTAVLALLASAPGYAAEQTPATATAPSSDVACKIHRTTAISYPVSLMRDGVVRGEARILANIDDKGKLIETLVLAYTHEPFAHAAITALREWRYEPARLNGETVGTVADISFRFEIDGILLVERKGIPVFTQQRDPFDDHFVYKPHGLRTLDGIPTPIHVTQPVYPKEWVDQGIGGSVTVNFYIDETGAVRMPAVDSTANPFLASAAAAAVREWKFSPPLRKGRPVLAHCQQIFTFAVDRTKS
jgi:TonB family protein